MNAMAIAVRPQETEDLEDLAYAANREHRLAQEAALTWVLHTIRAGDALAAARALVTCPWEDWIAENFHGSIRTATTYLRVAAYRDVLTERGVTTQAEALEFLRLHALRLPRAGRPQISPELRAEVTRLHAEGIGTKRIAQLLELSRTTTWAIVNPEKVKAQNARAKSVRSQKLKLLQREIRTKAAQKAGGSLERAYSVTLNLAATLDAALAEQGDREAKAALNAALHSLYRVEDQIVKAIGTSSPHPTS